MVLLSASGPTRGQELIISLFLVQAMALFFVVGKGEGMQGEPKTQGAAQHRVWLMASITRIQGCQVTASILRSRFVFINHAKQ